MRNVWDWQVCAVKQSSRASEHEEVMITLCEEEYNYCNSEHVKKDKEIL